LFYIHFLSPEQLCFSDFRFYISDINSPYFLIVLLLFQFINSKHKGNLTLLSHIQYHEGYVQPQTNTVGSPNQENAPPDALWKKRFLSMVQKQESACRTGQISLFALQAKVFFAVPHLAYKHEAAFGLLLDNTVVLDCSNPN
jgi:hypothetical protein